MGLMGWDEIWYVHIGATCLPIQSFGLEPKHQSPSGQNTEDKLLKMPFWKVPGHSFPEPPGLNIGHSSSFMEMEQDFESQK